jgi:hypothetical protein
MFLIVKKLFPVLLVALFISGCSSAVKREGASNVPATIKDLKLTEVVLTLTPDAKKAVSDNLSFNTDALKATVQRAVEAKGFLKADSGNKLVIELTGLRARSTFSAVMFGFMAGNDNVEGSVTVVDAAGKQLQKFVVSASYALGGIAGGQDSRMNWLYEEFAKLTVKELTGE